MRKRTRKRVSRQRLPALVPTAPNQQWSLDFLSDSLASGRKIRLLPVEDVFTREGLAIEVDTSLPGTGVVAVLKRLE